ncbi:hypothetical protein VTI74DRAFT_3596 [Chaetomium olivicolor]
MSLPPTAAAAPSTTAPNPLAKPALQTDLTTLRQTQTVLPPLDPSLFDLAPPPHDALPELSLPNSAGPRPNTNDVLLVIPTANKSKSALLTSHFAKTKPAHVNVVQTLTVAADSAVGEQPYDSAGPEGAFNRVVNAVAALKSDPRVIDLLGGTGQGPAGTVLVGAVENFICRRQHRPDESTVQPVDYGFVVFCRVSLAGPEAGKWEWRTAVSSGVTLPVEYWREAEGYGFEDGDEDVKGRKYGKVTVGEVLAANVPGVDKADWHLLLAGRSRYELLREAMERAEVPWPGGGNGRRCWDEAHRVSVCPTGSWRLD